MLLCIYCPSLPISFLHASKAFHNLSAVRLGKVANVLSNCVWLMSLCFDISERNLLWLCSASSVRGSGSTISSSSSSSLLCPFHFSCGSLAAFPLSHELQASSYRLSVGQQASSKSTGLPWLLIEGGSGWNALGTKILQNMLYHC